jgi:hypothetical protein
MSLKVATAGLSLSPLAPKLALNQALKTATTTVLTAPR